MNDYTLVPLNLQNSPHAESFGPGVCFRKKKHSLVNDPHSHNEAAALENPKWICRWDAPCLLRANGRQLAAHRRTMRSSPGKSRYRKLTHYQHRGSCPSLRFLNSDAAAYMAEQLEIILTPFLDLPAEICYMSHTKRPSLSGKSVQR
jgi:hypothetical protein